MAQTDFFSSEKRGWFYGEVPSKEEEVIKEEKPKPNIELPKKEETDTIAYKDKEYKKIPKVVDIPFHILDELDPKEIEEMEILNRKIATMYPTPENLTEYKKLQYFIVNKAKGFGSVQSNVMRTNPELANWVASIPKNNLQIKTNAKAKENKQKKVLQSFKDDVIILVAVAPDCPFCIKQKPLLDMFTHRYGVEYQEVDITKNAGFAQKYGVERTPTAFLLYKNKQNKAEITRISTGLQPLNDIVKSVMIGLYTFELIKDKDLL